MESLVKSVWKEVENNGTKSIKVSTLMKKLGVSKRSERTVAMVNDAFSESGLYIQPELSLDTSWNELLRIKDSPERPLGDLFSDERRLENYIAKHELFKKLGIETVDRQHSPKRTKDKLDFLGQSGDEVVVLELKNWGGGKSAVEQVLRYSGYKKDEAKGKPINIRKVLVTGIANRETAMAIRGMRPEERENFEWYLYNYNAKTGELNFVRITEKDIDEQLNIQVS